MPETNQTPTDQIMEQAQAFASAWSLVGGSFDQGQALEDAEAAKDDLRQRIDDLQEQHGDQVDSMVEAVQKLIDWHDRQTEQLEVLLSAAKDGCTISLGGDAEDIKLNSQSAYGMRLGIALAQHLLGKLPITLTRDE